MNQSQYGFAEALETTVDGYPDHPDWVNAIRSGAYRKWIEINYESRKI